MKFFTSYDVILQVTLYFTLPDKSNDVGAEQGSHSGHEETTHVAAGGGANHVNPNPDMLSLVTHV